MNPMRLHHALLFLFISALAGIFGFGLLIGTAATIAKVVFTVFFVLFIFALL